jgi:hypothetical protein
MTPPSHMGDARARTLYFLERHDRWPHWPFLPVVRRRLGRDAELGLVFDALNACDLAGYSATVFLTNLFLLPATLPQFLALPRETFDSAEELTQAGWRVDVRSVG